MKDDKKNKIKVIIIRETPEMANWMHPQTEERKERIRKEVEAAKERVTKRRNERK